MKKFIVLAVLLCFAAVPAFADVANEVIVGLEGDSTSDAESSTVANFEDKFETKNSLFTVQYSHFFTPLKEDDKPIDLRLFYQHPTNLFAGLAFIGMEETDTTTPGSDYHTEMSASVLQVGGEYFFPTNTGLFLKVGGGGGEYETTLNGISLADTEVNYGVFELGVRQYLVPSGELHLRYSGESMENTQTGSPKRTSDRGVIYLGGRGVIADVVGLMFEFGGGEVENETAGITRTSDIGAFNAEVAGYIGKHLSIRLGVEVEEEEENDLPAGFERTTKTARTTLAGRYWFSERFGLEVPLYSETVEYKNTFPITGEETEKITNSGIGVYGAFRF